VHASLKHPNIIQAYLGMEDSAAIRLFMEYAGGQAWQCCCSVCSVCTHGSLLLCCVHPETPDPSSRCSDAVRCQPLA
jgi:hypothetical protein